MGIVIADIIRNRISLVFSYDPVTVSKIKQVRGYGHIKDEGRITCWTVPLTLSTGRQLRALLGTDLKLGPNLNAWAKKSIVQERNLQQMVTSEDAILRQVGAYAPELSETLRPYQRADVAYMASASCINANEPRLGKTLETIAATVEAGWYRAKHLVIAPSEQSMETVWRYELEQYLDVPVFTLHGGTSTKERESIKMSMVDLDYYWFITTPNMVRAGIADSQIWKTVTVDEYHLMGLANPKSQLFKAMRQLEYERLWALSGTPIGGKAMNLWGVLCLLDPVEHSSKWRWVDTWLDVEEEIITVRGGARQKVKNIGGIRQDREEAFYRYHSRWIVRRLRSEVMDEIPNQVVDVWCKMGKKQTAQYEQFDKAAEIRIDELRLSGDSILTEYLWLKRFAGSVCELEEYEADCQYCQRPEYELNDAGRCIWCNGTERIMKTRALPTKDSCKLDALLDRLMESDEPVIVASQFTRFVEVAAEFLEEHGVECAVLTGKTRKKGQREQILHDFQSGVGPRVLVVNTKAAGVSIKLSRAVATHVLDETWNPDDQQQLIDRMFDDEAEEAKMVLYYRTRDTIDQDIAETNVMKSNVNEIVLDVHRRRAKRLTK